MDNSNINELDSYGVWVKPSSNSNNQIPDEQTTDTSDLSFDDLSNLEEESNSTDDFFSQTTEATEPANDFVSQETETVESSNMSEFDLDKKIEEDISAIKLDEPMTDEISDTIDSNLGDFEIPETSANSFINDTNNTFDPFETPSDDIFAIDDSMTGDPIVEEETEFEEQVNPYEDAFKDFTDIKEEDVSLDGTNISGNEETVFEESYDEPPVQEIEETASVENVSNVVENNSVESDILKQIVAELASLKSEISSLKENFNELRQQSEKISTEQKVEEPPVDTGGFFTDDDGDDTISLSGDELSNIMNSVDMSQAEVIDVSDTESQLGNDPFGEEILNIAEESGDFESKLEDVDKDLSETKIDDEPVITEESFGIVDEPAVSDDIFAVDDNAAPAASIDEFSEINADSFDTDAETENTVDFVKDSDATEYISDTDDISAMSEDKSEFDDIAFSSDLSVSEDTGFISGELPDEISVPKIDDVVVGSSDEDFMDSVKDIEDAEEKFGLMAEIPAELPYDALEGDTLGESIEEIEEELNSLEQEANEEFDTLQNVDEIMSADPEIHESITDSNMDYLKTDENADKPTVLYNDDEQEIEDTDEEIEESVPDADAPRTFVNDLLDTRDQDSEIPNSLKNEIKSVLLYMDQLLENLPEEKIVEFAQSEQFNTYKKLFAELGLS